MCALVLGLGVTSGGAAVATTTFTAAADAYVSSTTNTNNGSQTTLKVKPTYPTETAYLKFNVSGLAGPVQSATLRVYANSGLAWGFDAYTTTSSWTETGLNYTNAPARTTKLGSFPSGNLTGWISLDVTAAITGNGTYSFALVGTYWQEISLASRETGANAPQLLITTNGTPPPPDTQPPTPPTNLTATSTTTTANLTWTAATDNTAVTGYNLYRDGTKVGTTTSTSYGYSGLTCGTGYTLGVEAYDAAGNTSTRSTLVQSTAACPDTQAPTVPANLTQTGSTTSSVTFAWVGSTDNVGVTGYGTYLGATSKGTTTATATTISGLVCGTSYTVGVDAADAAGNRSARGTLTATTASCPVDSQAPTAPANLTAANPTGSSLGLSWSASTDDTAVTGYRLSRDGDEVGTTTGTSYSFAGLGCGTAYSLGVEAYDAAGNTSIRSTVTASTTACPDTQAPSVPANLTQTGNTHLQRHVRLGRSHRQRRRHGLRHLPRRDLEGHDDRDGHDDLGSRLRHELHRRRRRSRRSRQPLGQGDADRNDGVVPRRHAGADCADQSGGVGHDGELADTLVDGGDRRHRGHRLHPLPRCEPGGNHLRLDVVHLRRPRLRQQLHARRRSLDAVGHVSTRSTLVASTASCGPTSTTFVDAADAYVSSSTNTNNGNHDHACKVKQSNPTETAYLKFNVSGLSRPRPERHPPRLRQLRPRLGLRRLHHHLQLDRNRPQLHKRPRPHHQTRQLPLRQPHRLDQPRRHPAVTGNGTYSFALVGTYWQEISLASRESGANAPQLLITTNGTPPPPDTQPPTPPTNLTATSTTTTANLTWTAATDNTAVTGYNLYRSTTAGFTPAPGNRIAQPTSTGYADTGLAAGTYYYRVTARDAAGNESAPSAEASATATSGGGGGSVTPTPVPPANVAGVTVGPGFVEASARQVLRTSGDTVYVITSDDSPCQTGGSGVIRVWKGIGAQPTNPERADVLRRAGRRSASDIGRQRQLRLLVRRDVGVAQPRQSPRRRRDRPPRVHRRQERHRLLPDVLHGHEHVGPTHGDRDRRADQLGVRVAAWRPGGADARRAQTLRMCSTRARARRTRCARRARQVVSGRRRSPSRRAATSCIPHS